VENGGQITFTGRGSAPSFYISKLLGLTTIDRISADIKLFPERFITKERLLKTHSIPDIDLNLGNPEVFEKAQEEIIGKGHSYRMLAYGTVGSSSAWKLYARYAGIDFDLSNEVSEQIKQYEEDLKYADELEENEEQISIHDYVDEKYWHMIEESKKFLKTVYSITQHPCGFLLFDEGLIEEEIGLIRAKDTICAAIDGKSAEKYLFMKNDLLKVSVVKLIHETYERIGIKPDTFTEIIEKTRNDQLVWDIYSKGCTVSVNQFETEKTTKKAMRYSPKNISEVSSMVAAIRPGFKSLYAQYEKREPFSYGVKSIDTLIQTKQFPYSYLLYQENAMSILSYANIPVSETYEIIKAIAKKRHDDVMKYKQTFIPNMTDKLIHVEKLSVKKSKEISEGMWKVIEDSSNYSFNASHSLSVAGDSVYCAYLKSHYPVEFYETLIRINEEDGKKDKIELAKNEAIKFFGIKFPDFKFGMDNRSVKGNENTKEITMSLKTIKGFGSIVSENMVVLKQEFDNRNGKDFFDIVFIAESMGLLNKKFSQLILLNYFSDFGQSKTLMKFYEEFTSGKNRYQSKLSEKSKEKRLPLLREFYDWMKEEEYTTWEQIQNEVSVVDSPYSRYDKLDKMYVYVLDINLKSYHPIIKIQVLKTGAIIDLKVNQGLYYEHHFQAGDILFCKDIKKKFRKIKGDDGKWSESTNFDFYLNIWYKMTPEDKFLSE
ncbi:MAG: hypothetical protein PHU53_07335, partial [Thermoplasmata archaeon]|nr:hypothetical protein [Thermoplasmata archaeon]